MVQKALDVKIAKLKQNPNCGEFIIADAKDPDVAYGVSAPGKSPEHYAQEGKYRSLPELRELIRQVVQQGIVDIMLMSPHTNSILTVEERLFDHSHVTPVGRANDTTDIWVMRGSGYTGEPSLPNRSTTLDHLQCGHIDCEPGERSRGADLGLYSITYNNDAVLDRQTNEAYKMFRIEAERKGFRHFLEVFNPNAVRNPIADDKLGGFMNDLIMRTMSGVAEVARPLFLKMVYQGPKFTEELAHYDPQLIVGVLGGGAGTTYDAFKLIGEAQKYGARVALFGRKINNSENQFAFIEMLRRIVDGQVSPEEAVKAYHGILQGMGLKPYRSLEEDLTLQTNVMSYGGSGKTISLPSSGARTSGKPAGVAARGNGKWNGGDSPDFSSMTKEDRLAYHRTRLGLG
jgi:hypothetical protein